jgi:hypothetical protein
MINIRIGDLRETFWPTPLLALSHASSPMTFAPEVAARLLDPGCVVCDGEWNDTTLKLRFSLDVNVYVSLGESGHVEVTCLLQREDPSSARLETGSERITVSRPNGSWIWDRRAMVRSRFACQLLKVSTNNLSAQLLFSSGPPLLLTPVEEITSRNLIMVWFDLE